MRRTDLEKWEELTQKKWEGLARKMRRTDPPPKMRRPGLKNETGWFRKVEGLTHKKRKVWAKKWEGVIPKGWKDWPVKMGRSGSKNEKGWLGKVGGTDWKNGKVRLEKWDGLIQKKWEGLARKMRRSELEQWEGLTENMGRSDSKNEKDWLGKGLNPKNGKVLLRQVGRTDWKSQKD